MAPRYLNVSDLPAAQASAERARPASRAVESADAAASGSAGSGSGRSRKGDPVYSITSTPEAHSADMGRRMIVYGIQMFLRVVCLIAFVLVDHWLLRIVCGLGIVVLPWSAVLLANVGADRSERSSSYLGDQPGRSPAQLTTAPAQEETFDGETFEGETVDDSDLRSGMRDNGSGPRDG